MPENHPLDLVDEVINSHGARGAGEHDVCQRGSAPRMIHLNVGERRAKILQGSAACSGRLLTALNTRYWWPDTSYSSKLVQFEH